MLIAIININKYMIFHNKIKPIKSHRENLCEVERQSKKDGAFWLML